MTLDRPILIVGYGSIGRRHLQNLRALSHKNFILYRTGKSTLPDDEIPGIPVEYDLNEALAHRPWITIVANPTALHMEVALAAAKAGSHLFLEKPVSNTLSGVEKLRQIAHKKGLVIMVGYQFRFHPLLRQIKRLLETNEIGPVVSAQAHWGEYLPDWHPGEDYHQSYAAKKELGGGVILTLSHPFDYLRWLFGEVGSVFAVQSQNGGLGIDVEDSADILLSFKSGAIGNVHLDYIQHPPEHTLRIIGQKGVIFWDNLNGLLKWQSGKTGGKWKKLSVPKNFDRNTMFIDEMHHFLTCITNSEQPLCTIDDGITALRIALSAKQSAKEKQLVKL